MPRQRIVGALLILSAAFACAAGAATSPAAPASQKPVELDMKQFSELTFRAIGPTNMGGRVSDIAGLESDPATMFAATGTGGVFKTTNIGSTWTPVFEKEAVASTGAVAIWQKNPSIVWVGTG